MKRATASVFTAILLLVFFACGQSLAYGHNHPAQTPSKHSQHIIAEKCQVCDQLLSFGAVFTPQQVSTELPLITLHWQAPVYSYSFSFLTEASSRAPPAA